MVGPHRKSRLDRLYSKFMKSLPESQKIREERRIRREQNTQKTIKIPTWFEREYVDHFFEIIEFYNIPGVSIKYTNVFKNDNKFFSKVIQNLQIKITKQVEKFNNIKVMISCIAIFTTKEWRYKRNIS